jgi:hypothetical protein
MWRSKAVDPAPTLQLPGDGLHPKRPPREACLADRTTRSTCPGTGTKRLIGLITERDRTTLAASAVTDAPMSVKAFFSADWRIVDLLRCGHDRDGPLPVGGQALIRSRHSAGYGGSGAVGRSVQGQHGGAAAVMRARPLRKWPQVSPAAARPRQRAGSYQVTRPARRGEGPRGGRQIGSRPARGAAADMRARPSRELRVRRRRGGGSRPRGRHTVSGSG